MKHQFDLLAGDPHADAERIANASEEDVPAALWPRQLADLVDVLAAHFRRRGRPLDEALREAREVALALGLYMGGHRLYLPGGDILKTALMHACIYRERASGASCEALATAYGLSVRHIERIVARQSALRHRRRQRPLFPEPDA